MNNQTTNRAVAVAVVGAVMLGSVPPSGAAPVSSMTILKKAVPSSGAIDVRYRYYRGHRYYGGPGAAIGLGLGILGAAAGAAAYGAYAAVGPGYYAPGYYTPGYYGSPYRRSYYYPY